MFEASQTLNQSSLLAKPFRFIRVAELETSGARRELKGRAMTAVADRKKAAAQSGAPATGPGSEKYQRILDAAVEVIAGRGYFRSPGMVVAELAGESDCTV